MNLQITGHHLEVTPAIRDYISNKLERVTRHFDHVIDTKVMLTVEPLKHRAEMTLAHAWQRYPLRGCRTKSLRRG